MRRMKRLSAGVSRRYGRALLDVALAQGEAAALRRELEAAATLLGTSADLRAAFGNPLAQRGAQEEAGADGLVRVRRLRDLPAPAEPARRARPPRASAGDRRRLPRASCSPTRTSRPRRSSPRSPLDKDQLAALEAALRKATGKGVEVDASLDPELLGGVLVRLGGRHYDGSVRGRLKALRAESRGSIRESSDGDSRRRDHQDHPRAARRLHGRRRRRRGRHGALGRRRHRAHPRPRALHGRRAPGACRTASWASPSTSRRTRSARC